MYSKPTPREILETLLPHLRMAAAYARQIQPMIATLPSKDEGDNFFAAALTDADVAVQNLVEVVLLGSFPQISFYGEEFELSSNTKYFRSLKLEESGDYLITLDPIDGTQFYKDGHTNYQIILGVLGASEYEAVLAITPALNVYFYAIKGEGTFRGPLEADLEACEPLKVTEYQQSILLGWSMGKLTAALQEHYQVIDVATCYSKEAPMPNLNGILSGDIAGAAIRRGKFIDGAAIAFLAKEAGCIVTTFDGSEPPPLSECSDYSLPGLLVASSKSVHQHLLEAVQWGMGN
ncbi:MAG: inositol monophosphatase family protein [Symploca sp. SIO2E6]|nr:inositol monophosphatase family protein [Symploca sp. SIO2E6]